MRKTVFILLTGILLFSACGNKVYDKYHHTPLAGWEKNDTLSFDIPKVEKPDKYNIDLGLRINKSFPFMGLTLIVEQTLYPGAKIFTDTLNTKLINKNGSPFGRGLSYYQYTFHIREIMLQHGDSLHITVRHDMKHEILPGISDVGITLSHIK